MKKILLIYCIVATVAAVAGGKFLISENRRLKNNQSSLSQEVLHYRTRLGEEAASARSLRLLCGEYEELRARDAEKIRAMGIRIRRLESASKSVTVTGFSADARLRDTVFVRDTVVLRETLRTADTLRSFRWGDGWVEVEGFIENGKVHCNVTSIDTLQQIVHRVPRKFLFFRCGTKAIRQEIVSSNPHTRIAYTEYIELGRHRRRR